MFCPIYLENLDTRVSLKLWTMKLSLLNKVQSGFPGEPVLCSYVPVPNFSSLAFVKPISSVVIANDQQEHPSGHNEAKQFRHIELWFKALVGALTEFTTSGVVDNRCGDGWHEQVHHHARYSYNLPSTKGPNKIDPVRQTFS